MTEPIEDQKLVYFLKRNLPNPPDSIPDLEERIIVAIAQEPRINKTTVKRFWLVPAAIVTSVLITVSGYFLFKPTQLQPVAKGQEAELEAFLINNWDSTLHDSSGDKYKETHNEEDFFRASFQEE
jgi:hypothetical protein